MAERGVRRRPNWGQAPPPCLPLSPVRRSSGVERGSQGGQEGEEAAPWGGFPRKDQRVPALREFARISSPWLDRSQAVSWLEFFGKGLGRPLEPLAALFLEGAG